MLTAAQIVEIATLTAKCPGYTTYAGQLLNAILTELCQDYDFDTITKTYTFTFDTSTIYQQYIAGCGPNYMPSDFLRAKNREVIFYIQGVRYVLIILSQAEFDALVQTAGFNSYPVNGFINVGNGLATPALFVWPPASGAYTATVVYYPKVADIATPESSSDIPWFPNQTYLIRRLAGELMQMTDDSRIGEFLGSNEETTPQGAGVLLRKYLKLKDDPEGRVNRVTLDRRRFGNSFDGLKNTKLIGW